MDVSSLLINPELKILIAGSTLVDTHWDGLTSYRRDGYSRLYHVKGGVGRITVEERDITVKPGEILLIPSSAVFKLISSPGLDHDWIHFDIRTREGLPLFDLVRPGSFSRRAVGGEALHFSQITRFWNRAGTEGYLNAVPLLNLLLIPFLHPLRPILSEGEEGADLPWLYRALVYLNRHLAEEISLEDLARRLGCHPTYLSNAFSRKFGIPPRSYLLKRRVEQAQQLLWHGDAPLKEVASLCGFGDVYYFHRSFKKLTGMTPGEYRRGREPYRYERITFR